MNNEEKLWTVANALFWGNECLWAVDWQEKNGNKVNSFCRDDFYTKKDAENFARR